MTQQRLPFKEMCARFDVTPRTLRYYEYIELLSPEKDGRARYYGPREIARMTLILRGRRWGFSLEDIRKWLLIYDAEGNEVQLAEWVKLADAQLEQLRKEQVQLAATIAELQKTRDDIVTALETGQPAPKPEQG